jgi:O-methyltransferase involved in polyketide biosynthesis
MRIFAADHVTTLAWTQVRFWERGLPKPVNLTFVPMDLEADRLGERLAEFGFDQKVASFCSVLGVMQYLDGDAVEALLQFASSLVSDSEIVFSFVLPDGGTNKDEFAHGFGSNVEAMGEPWKTFHRPRDLVEQLGRMGFRDVFHLAPEYAQQRYFSDRQDGLRAPQSEQLIAAIV